MQSGFGSGQFAALLPDLHMPRRNASDCLSAPLSANGQPTKWARNGRGSGRGNGNSKGGDSDNHENPTLRVDCLPAAYTEKEFRQHAREPPEQIHRARKAGDKQGGQATDKAAKG